MRTKNVEIGDYTYKVTYPDLFIMSHSPESYVRVHRELGNEEIQLILRNYTYFNGVTVKRTINPATGDAVFPIADMLDFLADMAGAPIAKAVEIILAVGGNAVSIFNITALIGATDDIIRPLDNGMTGMFPVLSNAPFPNTLPVYPNGPEECRVVPVFYPMKNVCTVRVQFRSTPGPDQEYDGGGIVYVYLDNYPLETSEDGYKFVNISTCTDPSVPTSFKSVLGTFKVDTCAKGLFTRWTDRRGFPFFYRWDVEKVVEEADNVDTYIGMAAENLDPYDIEVKSSKMVYTLHSGMVEDEIYGLASSILSAQKVEYYDQERSRWIRCSVRDGEVENNLEDLKEVVIELVKTNRTIQ